MGAMMGRFLLGVFAATEIFHGFPCQSPHAAPGGALEACQVCLGLT